MLDVLIIHLSFHCEYIAEYIESPFAILPLTFPSQSLPFFPLQSKHFELTQSANTDYCLLLLSFSVHPRELLLIKLLCTFHYIKFHTNTYHCSPKVAISPNAELSSHVLLVKKSQPSTDKMPVFGKTIHHLTDLPSR